jgi:hypothetical protein
MDPFNLSQDEARQTALTLRPYQLDGLTAIEHAIARGIRRVGKTVLVVQRIPALLQLRFFGTHRQLEGSDGASVMRDRLQGSSLPALDQFLNHRILDPSSSEENVRRWWSEKIRIKRAIEALPDRLVGVTVDAILAELEHNDVA